MERFLSNHFRCERYSFLLYRREVGSKPLTIRAIECFIQRRTSTVNVAGEQGPGHERIDIRLLQGAITVAEELNLSRAAERLGITQPALTKRIHELEQRLG